MDGDANEGEDKKEETAPQHIAKAWREAKIIYLKFLLLFFVEHLIFLLPLLEIKFTIGRRYSFAIKISPPCCCQT